MAIDSAILWSVDIGDKSHWHHVQCDAPGARSELAQFGVSTEVVDALTILETRPRAISLDGGTLLILRSINRNPGADPDDMIAVRIWFNEQVIVTSRRRTRPLGSLTELRDHYAHGESPRRTSSVVVDTISRIAERIGEFVEDLDDSIDTLEDDIEQQRPVNRARLAALRRETAAVRRYLSPQREAIDTLSRMQGVLADEDLEQLHEDIDRTLRYLEDLDLARERTVVLQDELRSRLSEQQNERMYVLSLITAIFLPLSFLTGVLGMNVGGVPLIDNPLGFIWTVGLMAALGVCGWLVFRWKRWL
ncbi:MAG: zinc transporter ZntB [Pseudomonadota bacterium]